MAKQIRMCVSDVIQAAFNCALVLMERVTNDLTVAESRS
jgi:hypothetical protein